MTDDQVTIVLDLARDGAHGTERRHASIATHLAGVPVGQAADTSLDDVVDRIGGLLDG